MANDPDTLILGHVLSPTADGGWTNIPDGALLIGSDGIIEDVGERVAIEGRSSGEGVEIIDHRPALLLPGFIDSHVHLAQVFARARVAGTLLKWLETAIFPAELAFADVGYAERAARAYVADCARNGVTTSLVFPTSHPNAVQRCFEILAASGLRAIMGLVHMDVDAPEGLKLAPEASIAAADELADRWHGFDEGRLRYAITPRFALSCSDAMMDGLGRMLERRPDLYVHTHCSENVDECAAVAARFPTATDYVGVYERFGLVGPTTVLAHGIQLSDGAIGRLAGWDAALSHCPSSNLFLKSGVFRWADVRDAGVRFGLGSDVGAGAELSPLRVARDAAVIQPELFVPSSEILWRATRGGAQALGLEDVIGSLEPGREADVVVLDPTRRRELCEQPRESLHQLFDGLVHLGDDRIVVETRVRGRVIDP